MVQNSSIGCSVAQEGAAYCSSVGCSRANKLAIEDATKLSRVQRIIDVCDGWGEGRGILFFKVSGPMERYTLGICYWLPEIGHEGKHFVLEKVNLLFSAMGGCAWRVYEPKKSEKTTFDKSLC
jgi:hypothetical protein